MPVVAGFAVPHPPIILPEVGHGEEKSIQKTMDAYRAAMKRAADYKPDTVVLTSPHTAAYADYFHISPGRHAQGDFGKFGAPEVRVEADYDSVFVSELERCCGKAGVPAGTMGERDRRLDHATMIPLHFLQEFYRGFRLVRIGLSGLSPRVHYRLGQCIAETAEKCGRRVVFLASGDLSHKLRVDGPYGFAAEGPKFDRIVSGALDSGNFLRLLELDPEFCESAGECGLRSFWIMSGALDRKEVLSKLLSYEGPFGVGYGVASFQVGKENAERNLRERMEADERRRLSNRRASEDPYVCLARLSLETYVKTEKYAELPEDLPLGMKYTRAGVFVTLRKDGQLRGCIGTIEPTKDSVAEEILHNAVSAALHDPRFAPVEPEELPQLVYSVDVLGEPESVDSAAELDPKQYGVIVKDRGRCGLLLPALAGINTAEEQISIARRKANIGPKEPIQLFRFRVVRHK